MLFSLATPEYSNVQLNTTKVRVHLRSGIAEILEQHQDLMGKIDNNIIEIETNFENKTEKTSFVLQDAVFIVSNEQIKGSDFEGTGIYIYAKRVKEITSSISLEEITQEYEEKAKVFETDKQVLANHNMDPLYQNLNTKLFILKKEVDFLKKVVSVVKPLKQTFHT